MKSGIFLIFCLTCSAQAWSENCCSFSGHASTYTRYDSHSPAGEFALYQALNGAYRNPTKGIQAKFNLDLRVADSEFDAQSKQLFFEKASDVFMFRVGRITTSDMLGYYSLDGVQLKLGSIYHSMIGSAGVPRKIEDYRDIHISRLAGVSWKFKPEKESVALWRSRSLYLDQQKIGLQYLYNKNNRQSSTSLNYNLSATSSSDSRFQWQLNSRVDLDRGKLQKGSMLIDLPLSHNKTDKVRLKMARFTPNEEALDFDQQFYQQYATGSQSRLETSYYLRIKPQRTVHTGWRYVEVDEAEPAAGLHLTLERKRADGSRDVRRFDYLYRHNQSVTTAYFRRSTAVNALLRHRAGLALQYFNHEKEENNTSFAIEYQADYFLNSKALMSAYVTGTANTNDEDDLRIALRFNWYFDRAVGGEKP